MRAVVQRVTGAEVRVDGEVVGRIDRGLCLLVGVRDGDSPEEATWVADKVANLRIFSDRDGKMNLSLLDVGGGALVVSQFTLYGDTRKGRRPSFVEAAKTDAAEPLVEAVCERLRELGVPVEEGAFGASMEVELTNEGPVTLLLESP